MNTPVNYYKDLKILILDDNSEARFTLRNMLEGFGAENIDVVTTGATCLNQLRSHEYDLILCDYNLGAGIDGQQVLEEARDYKLLNRSCCYVMVTAEAELGMVMGVLEYQPDGYLTKPFTKQDLRTRLDRILRTKFNFADVDKAIDAKDFDKAITLCNKKIMDKPNYAMRCMRTKAELLLDQGKVDEAEEIYNKINTARPMVWSLLGKGKCQHLQNHPMEAISTYKDLIQNNKMFMEAYDCLAKAQLDVGQTHEAQKTLQDAAAKSPKAILRQMELGRIAGLNDDWEVAEVSFKKAVSLGRFSCHKTSQNYLNLCNALRHKVETADAKHKSVFSGQALRVVNDLEQEFKNDEDSRIQGKLMESSIYRSAGDDEKALSSLDQAKDRFQRHMKNASPELLKKMVDNLMENGDIEAIKEIQAEFAGRMGEGLTDEISSHMHEALEQAESNSMNNEAVDLFKQGRIVEAGELFTKALQSRNASTSLLLNALQTNIEIMKKGLKPPRQMIPICEGTLSRLSSIDRSSRSYPRYQKLSTMFKELRREMG